MKLSEINHLKQNRINNENWQAVNKAISYAEAQADKLVFDGDHETAAPIVCYLAASRVALNNLCKGNK